MKIKTTSKKIYLNSKYRIAGKLYYKNDSNFITEEREFEFGVDDRNNEFEGNTLFGTNDNYTVFIIFKRVSSETIMTKMTQKYFQTSSEYTVFISLTTLNDNNSPGTQLDVITIIFIVFGVVAFLVILIVICCCCSKKKKKKSSRKKTSMSISASKKSPVLLQSTRPSNPTPPSNRPTFQNKYPPQNPYAYNQVNNPVNNPSPFAPINNRPSHQPPFPNPVNRPSMNPYAQPPVMNNNMVPFPGQTANPPPMNMNMNMPQEQLYRPGGYPGPSNMNPGMNVDPFCNPSNGNNDLQMYEVDIKKF